MQKKVIDKKNLTKKISPPGGFEPLDLCFKGERSNHYAIAAGLQTNAECADYMLYALLYALVYVLKKSENIVTLAADTILLLPNSRFLRIMKFYFQKCH